MNLLVPTFLSAAAVMGLPLLLHLLRMQSRKHVPFPSLHFLGRDALRDSNRHRMRRWLTFLLRCLFIALVVLAFSRPYWSLEHSQDSRAVVVVVDNSYSMQAAGRREAVEAWLAPQIGALRAPDQLGVVILHPSPSWLVPLSENLEAGRTALKTLPQAYESTHYRAGLELAAAKLALSNLKQKQLLLAADEQRSGWSGVRFERQLPAGVKLFPAPPAPLPKRQAAVTGLKAVRTADGRLSLDANVRNYDGNDERTVTFYAGKEKLGTQPCTLSAGQTQTIHGEYSVPDINAALMLRAAIDPDDLPVDDVAYTALAATSDRRILLAPPGSAKDLDYLRLALEAASNGKLPGFQIETLSEKGSPWAPSSVVILRGAAAFRSGGAARIDTFLDAGGSAWLLCDGSPEQAAWLATRGIKLTPARPEPGEKLKFRDLVLDHPLFSPFAAHSLAPILTPAFQRGWSLEGETIEPLARWLNRGVAIAEVPTGAGRLLVTGFGETRADSTFPLSPGYVPFIHQAASWLAQNQMVAPVGCRVGATLVLPGPGTWRAVDTPRPVAPSQVTGLVTPAVPGLYEFEQKGTPLRYYAVNLDTIESDLTPWPNPTDFARLVSTEKPKDPAPPTSPDPKAAPVADPTLIDERQVWWWLLVAAIGVALAELALANRTIP